MRRRTATTRITLQAHALPETAENTELNYRTCVTTSRQDTATTVRLLSIVTLAFIVIGVGLRLLSILPPIISGPIVGIVVVVMLVRAYFRFLKEMPSGIELLLALIALVVCVLFAFVNYAPTMRAAYGLIFGTAVALTALFSHLATMQVCAFMAVNERIRLKTVRRWQWYLSLWNASKSPRGCPELTHYRLSYPFLVTAFLVGYGVVVKTEENGNAGYAATFGVLGFLGCLFAMRLVIPDLGGAPRPTFVETVKGTWRALKTFVCYNRHHVEAAGLFRFPLRALRPPLARDLFLGLTLAFLTTAFVGVSVSSPTVFIEQHWPAAKQPEAKPQAKPEPPKVAYKLTTTEEEFSRTLPADQQKQYFEAKQREHEAAQVDSQREAQGQARVETIRDMGVVLLMSLFGPSTVLFTVLWFTSGQLLNRFYEALEAPDAYEVRPEPTEEELKEGKRGTTPWDNRVERIRSSNDNLEREHLYLGSSIEGDFPVLLHQNLLYRHAHILGDTGSRKTSIGIAPVLTQLIARENCSVIIFDLKGDPALFNAAREEATVAGLPFRWFTNIVGESSYVFNPLAQSHLHRLTTDQLTQGILQALELEHGEGYGRGHFTALNDVVLGACLRKHRQDTHSFKKLHGFLSSRDNYRNISKDDEDWRQTRQLVNLLDKMAHLGPMNVTAESMKDRPRVIEQQIDMPDVLRTPQVIYFYLSSTLDPRTVSPIAKLAMFALLAAAEFRKQVEPRCFVFIDEFQRVISEAMTIFFEQARSKGLHFILANQTISQLNSKGVDITGVIDSCTGFKQSFRVSDQENLKRIIETSGEALYHSVAWTRVVNDAFNEQTPHLLSLAHALRNHRDDTLVNVSEQVASRMERNTVIETSAHPLSSFVKFDEGSGYTQYAGYWTTVLNEYHISKALYDFLEGKRLPPVDAETIAVPGDPPEGYPEVNQFKEGPIPIRSDASEDFDSDLKKRLNAAAESHNGQQGPQLLPRPPQPKPKQNPPKQKGPTAPQEKHDQ
jgi:TraM recognition site of TraD and TraG